MTRAAAAMSATRTTSNGVTIRTLRRAPRGLRLKNGDLVGVFYAGSLSDGTPFDANIDFNGFRPLRQLFVFELGAGRVIQGWDQGLLNRRVGEVLELTIPPELGYGSSGTGSIPPNATLIFRVELLGAVPAAQPTGAIYYDLQALGLTLRSLGLKAGQLPQELLSAAEGRLRVGTDGNDAIAGGDADELLVGLRGNDRILGGGGRDIQAGGKGADIFVINALSDSGVGPEQGDVITDFQGRNGDRIDLSAVDLDSAAGGVQGFRFIGVEAFSGQAGELRYLAGLLQGDANGDRVADLEIQLLGSPKLLENHLLL